MTSTTKVKISLLPNNFAAPERATEHAGGYDVFAAEAVEIAPGQTVAVSTGVKVALPNDWALLVLPRSGISFKTGVRVANAPGLVDADYRGEVKVLLNNTGPHAVRFNRGERIAQIMFVPYFAPVFDVVPEDELSNTARGVGGFGSTGV